MDCFPPLGNRNLQWKSGRTGQQPGFLSSSTHENLGWTANCWSYGTEECPVSIFYISFVFLPSPVSVYLSSPSRAPLKMSLFPRARFGEDLFFFTASSAYLKAALTLLALTLGSLLTLDLALGDTNLVKVFTGRERRSLVMDTLSSISVSEVLTSSSFSFILLWQLLVTLFRIISVADYGKGRWGLCGHRKVRESRLHQSSSLKYISSFFSV